MRPISRLISRVPLRSLSVAFVAQSVAAQGAVFGWGSQPGTAGDAGTWPIVKLSAGSTHNVALLEDGSLREWATTAPWVPCTPVVPTSLGPFSDVSAGLFHTVALCVDGSVVAAMCAGGTNRGQATVPIGLTGVTAVDAGDIHTMALKGDGTIVSWGGWIDSAAPLSAPPESIPARAISANGQASACIRIDGRAFMWGVGAPPSGLPFTHARSLALGVSHGVAVLPDGRVTAWNDPGQLHTAVPSDLGEVVAVDAGFNFSVALRADGSVRAWGDPNLTNVPEDLPPIRLLSAGRFHAVAATCTATLEAFASPELAPFSFAQPRVHEFSNLAPGSVGAELEVVARGNLGSSTKFLTVRVDGAVVANGVFGSGSGASNCSIDAVRRVIPLDPAAFASFVADGRLVVRLEPSLNATSAGCDSATLSVALRYQRVTVDCDGSGLDDQCELPFGDCDGNGVLDSCEIATGAALDCDGSGEVDACQIAVGAEDKNANGRLDACELASGDLNLDGIVDGVDLGGLLAVWGQPSPPYGDLDGDGVVDGADLGMLLANWGNKAR